MRNILTIICLLLSTGITTAEGYKPYKPTTPVTGSAGAIGSDTLNNMMALWLETFQKFHPTVKISIEGKGSSTAPPALIEATAQLAPMSRAMKNKELDKFEERYGYPPTQFRVALDALAIIVNKDNPIEGLTLQEADAIFSINRKREYSQDVDRWSKLGINLGMVSLYGRNSASGTYGFFKKIVLGGGDFKSSVKEQPGSASVVQGVSSDPNGIGYSGIGYMTSSVKIVPLGKEKGKYYDTSETNVLSGKYPLGRFLYLYVNKAPNQKLSPLVEEFIRFIFSEEGQHIVDKDGYMRVPASIIDKELSKL
jgi:phosphate transport system substrate-binding protein